MFYCPEAEGAWPEGPGKLSPGFTLGFCFIARGPEAKGRQLTRSPRNHIPEDGAPFSFRARHIRTPFPG
jgi:hypothetical protein